MLHALYIELQCATCVLNVAIIAERNESSFDAGVDRFYLSDEFEEEEDETRPGPSKCACWYLPNQIQD